MRSLDLVAADALSTRCWWGMYRDIRHDDITKVLVVWLTPKFSCERPSQHARLKMRAAGKSPEGRET